MKRNTTQRANSFTLAWHWPTSPRDTLGQSHHPSANIADILMHAETLLRDGFGVTITPPATQHQPRPTVENVIDLEVISHG